MLVAPPGRLSTITCCLNTGPMRSAIERAVKSVLPPAANGTMTRTGLTGYDCAPAGAAINAAAAAANRIRVLTRFSSSYVCDFVFERFTLVPALEVREEQLVGAAVV